MTDILQSLVSYAAPSIFMFFGGFLLWQIRRERLRLEYTVGKSGQFPTDSGFGKYFVAGLKNSGNRALTDIDVRLTLNNASISNIAFSDPALVQVVDQSDTEVRVSVPLLNPTESVEVTVTASEASDDTKLGVRARTAGVTAEQQSEKSIFESIFSQVGVVVVGIGIALALNSAMSIRRQTSFEEKVDQTVQRTKSYSSEWARIQENLEKQLEELQRTREQEKQGKPDREQIIFSVLVSAGLNSLIPDFMLRGKVTYWKTGVFLTHAYAINPQIGDRVVTALTGLVNLESMAAPSKGYILYLLSKIECHRGNIERAEDHLNRCRDETPLMYDFLMKTDQQFDLSEWHGVN